MRAVCLFRVRDGDAGALDGRYDRAMSDQRDRDEPPTGTDLEYEAALAEYRRWDRRAAESQSCDIAVAAQRSLERVRALEGRRARSGGDER
jgi:hypothetical protein